MIPPLPLASIPPGEEVLIDANVLVYGALALSTQCQELLRRCALRDISGFTTVETLSDACHRLMVGEAAGLRLIARPNAANLQGKPHVVRALNDYWRRIEQLRAGNVAILPLDEYRFVRAQALRQVHGLMTTDSLLLAAANVFGISSLVTADSDFEPVPGLTVYKPTDLP